jgi:type III secretion protein S
MNDIELVAIISRGLYITLMLSMPAILAATIMGTLVSILQALTQVQEQNISFVVKLVTMVIVLYMTLSWMGSTIFEYTMSIFQLMNKL